MKLTLEQLNQIEKVYWQNESGISVPNDINEVWSYFSDTQTNQMNKIRHITRFYMLSFQDAKEKAIHDSLIDVESSEVPEFTGDKRSKEYKDYKEKYGI